MYKWLSQRFSKDKLKTRRLQEIELNDNFGIRDNTLKQATSDHPLTKIVLADSEQTVTIINERMLAEVDSEIKKIIAQSKLESQETTSRGGIDDLKQSEAIMSAALKKIALIRIEAKQNALQLLNRANEETGKVARMQAEKDDSPPVQTHNDIARQAAKGKGLTSRIPVGLDKSAGEAVIFVTPSGGLRVLSMFYSYLQGISELKVLSTSGSYEGTIIEVALGKSLSLTSILSQIAGIEVTSEPLGKDDPVATIKLDLKEA